VLFFDLDDTLYSPQNGLWLAIRDRMRRYLIEHMDFSPEEVDTLRQEYFVTYGTTLRGLLINHPGRTNADDYLAYVHDIPLQDFIRPDPSLRALLLSLPQHRWIFTNSDDRHATRVLDVLGMKDCFDGIIDIRALGYACKPVKDAYLRALVLAGEEDPSRCLMFDDSPRNLAPARTLGFSTVLVGPHGPDPSANYSISSLHELPKAMPELWTSWTPPKLSL
jgi:putative hydrolase of the HAD superfamily